MLIFQLQYLHSTLLLVCVCSGIKWWIRKQRRLFCQNLCHLECFLSDAWQRDYMYVSCHLVLLGTAASCLLEPPHFVYFVGILSLSWKINC